MTQVTIGTGSGQIGAITGGAIREDLENMISNVDRKKAPFSESIGKTKASNVLHEWLTDEYDNPSVAAHAEGGTFASDSNTTRSRLGNYTQIFRKDIAVSGTVEAVDKAGVASELDYQLKKALVEIRRNVDTKYLRHTNVLADGGQVAFTTVPSTRAARGVFAYAAGANMSWLGASVALTLDNGSGTALTGAGNVVSAAADPTAPSNYAENGTNFIRYSGNGAAVTRANIEATMEEMYVNGGNPNMAMMPASQKTAMSALFSSNATTSAAERKLTAMESKVNIAVTGVMTDFGNDIMMVPNYLMRNATNFSLAGSGNDTILFYESSAMKRAQLRPAQTIKLDRGGDGYRAIVLCEETLVVQNPNSVGAIFNAT